VKADGEVFFLLVKGIDWPGIYPNSTILARCDIVWLKYCFGHVVSRRLWFHLQETILNHTNNGRMQRRDTISLYI
jgi:hypothetical protein